MAPKHTLSALEWLSVGSAALKTLSLGFLSLFVIPFQRSKGPPTFSQHLAYTISRTYTTNFSPKSIVATSPTTGECYQKFVTSQGLNAKTVTLPDGTKAHWLGDPTAEKILLFFHGGGYLVYATDGHFHLLHESLKAVEQQGGKLAVLFLEYDVSLDAPYPRQLQQATALLQYTLTELQKKPEQILLAGDSAGGNLALALLSHLSHPHPQVDAVNLSASLSGTALLSPWVTFETTSESMKANAHRDALAIPALHKWASLFRGSAPSDPYLEPLSAPANWWQPLLTKKVLITAGADEIFVDDIQKFAAQLSSASKDVEMHTTTGEPHDYLVMEFLMGHPRTQQRDIFEKWALCMSENVDMNFILYAPSH
ncbi:alpha/beta-hydrolase [Penicillium chermesinum]|uniref:Alpha/beta-hydrolase n=1 Tax=Penicillium chermesinum TaxID=63820 RepID=A0A9W9P8P6_9EURO|nr:alpha/beta-hydrolase [Penicillium chermesinum]KAJ5239867.1 alpha/beta-hydrolase [Penicillium chermesinum]KAJ6166747.1 alpha/beta-hydrolase [Penicillium chermesinum]